MTTMAATATDASVVFRPAKAGDVFVGPRDLYRFLITGEETGGAYFAMEALVAPGGGPPPGDYVSVPRGVVHNFHNPSDGISRLILTFTPAGMEHFFLETLERVANMDVEIPDNLDAVAERYVEAAPRYGMIFM